MDYLQWVLLALELLFRIAFCFEIDWADPTNPFAQALYNFTGFFLIRSMALYRLLRLGLMGMG